MANPGLSSCPVMSSANVSEPWGTGSESILRKQKEGLPSTTDTKKKTLSTCQEIPKKCANTKPTLSAVLLLAFTHKLLGFFNKKRCFGPGKKKGQRLHNLSKVRVKSFCGKKWEAYKMYFQTLTETADTRGLSPSAAIWNKRPFQNPAYGPWASERSPRSEEHTSASPANENVEREKSSRTVHMACYLKKPVGMVALSEALIQDSITVTSMAPGHAGQV